jgi:hypothetical protein
LRTAAVSYSFIMVGMANGSEIAVETVVEAAGGVEVGGGACDEDGSRAMRGAPDITDTRLIGFRILLGISLNE